MKRENEESVDEAKEKSEEVSNGVHSENGSQPESNGTVSNGVNGTTPTSTSPNNEEKTPTKLANDTPTEVPQTPPVQGFHNVKSQENNANNSQNNEIVPLSKPTDSHKKKEIYRFTSKEPLFSCAWSNKSLGESFRLAICTCKEDDEGFEDNKISILEYDESRNELVERCSFHHGFPASCMMFNPSKPNQELPDIIATATNGLKIFKYDSNTRTATHETTMTSKPYNGSVQCSPFTCLDWLESSPEYIGTSCIDSTCSIWNIEYGVEVNRFSVNCNLKTQLIAHDECVNSIAFSNMESSREQFATASEGGSVRLFDARNLQHSTILYDDSRRRPLNHIAWNKKEPYTIAILPHGSTEVLMIDIRKLQIRDSITYNNHNSIINSMAWAPHSEIHICTVGIDHQALIWQTDRVPREEPILAYKAAGEIRQVKWSKAQSEWIAITFGNNIEVLRV